MISRSILEMLCSSCVSSLEGTSSSLGGVLERVVGSSRCFLASGLYIVFGVVVLDYRSWWSRGTLVLLV